MITGLNLKCITKGLDGSLLSYNFHQDNKSKVYYGWRILATYHSVCDTNYFRSIKSSDDIVKVLYRLQRFR